MAELERIKSILRRVFQQLEKDWEEREEEEIENTGQADLVNTNQY